MGISCIVAQRLDFEIGGLGQMHLHSLVVYMVMHLLCPGTQIIPGFKPNRGCLQND